MKYYMDQALHPSIEISSDSDNDEPHVLATPTKHGNSLLSADDTPRPRLAKNNSSINSRSQPRLPALSFDNSKKTHFPSPIVLDSQHYGFTLSYLRRVPTLADMAERVAKAERRRRVREERKKCKELGNARSHPSDNGGNPASTSLSPTANVKLSQQVKELFKRTIIRLLQDGSIFLWDGPVRPILPPQDRFPESHLWTTDISNTNVSANSTIFSSTIGISQTGEGQEEVVISDPEDNEESYIPMSPNYLAGFVEAAIGAINKKYEDARRRGQLEKGATREAVLRYLKQDDRWRYVGEWSIIEALEVLRKEGRAWSVGKGQWELSI